MVESGIRHLELLAPARTADIGIAAIRCGADAVYIGGPSFGARVAASNSIEDIRTLCEYAHLFGAKVFATVNTLIYEDEIPSAREMVLNLKTAGVDALIVQDMAMTDIARGTGLPLHASTQCSIRTPEKAAFLASCGFERLILERQLSLEDIRGIRAAVPGTELEFFVHGALCVCYSGECYLSEHITGRSANRGECAQPCRALYDLEDLHGHTLARNKALLSLKDYNLYEHLQSLVDAGVTSFKIEGRLKNESYVRNVVAAYSARLDEIVAASGGRFVRASRGRSVPGFAPSLDKTFNRGYTSLYISGKRAPGWSSMDAPKGMGEKVGVVTGISADGRTVKVKRLPAVTLSNGDGLSFPDGKGGVIGFKADVVREDSVTTSHKVDGLFPGAVLFRNYDITFERDLSSHPDSRLLTVPVSVSCTGKGIRVSCEGCLVEREFAEVANNTDRQLITIREQLSKVTDQFSFSVSRIYVTGSAVPFARLSELNTIRRDLAAALREKAIERQTASRAEVKSLQRTSPSYGIALMRSKYCVRFEMGLCPKQGKASRSEPLVLKNNGRELRLDFDCRHCEMTVSEK
ncbi:MAG: U32 family peptidase [Bacteroidales bacterium]|nr:U32 family peptidase [Bacteroidales bacterium]